MGNHFVAEHVADQQQFLNEQLQPVLEEAQAGRGQVFFVDAAHFVFGTFLCCLWSFGRLFLKAAAGRQRFNVLGAWNAIVMELAERLHIRLRFLPGYSPNLNLIERLWKFIKRDTLRGRYDADFATFRAAITTCLTPLSTTHRPKRESLITLNFQTFENASVMTG